MALQKIKNNDEIKEKELIPKLTNKRAGQMDMKALCLILAYLMRLDEIDKHFDEDIEFILGKAPYLISMMTEMSIQLAV
jgi:hypothetical protein